MTAVLDKADTESGTEQAEPGFVASWPSRAGAFAVDVLFGLAVLATLALVALTAPLYSWLWWVSIVIGGLVLLLIALNRWLAPALTGWSLGRALFGVAVTRRRGGVAVTVGVGLPDTGGESPLTVIGYGAELVEWKTKSGRSTQPEEVSKLTDRLSVARPGWAARKR